jgi:outer membrane protein assembly factor BamB
MINSLRVPAALVLALLLAACAEKNVQPPAELTEYEASADIDRVWTHSVSGNAPRLRLGLGLAAAGDVVFTASYNGEVVALDRATGKRLWRRDTKLKLTGGPGAGDGLVVVGSAQGDIVALDAATGEQKWSIRINSEILSAPAIGGTAVLVRAGDGRLVALRAADGTQIWSAEEEVPRLSLRGTARPLVSGGLAVAGFDNGRVLALELLTGNTVWELNIAPPAGRSELDRLVDIDTALQAMDENIYVVTYQGKAASIDREVGQTLWTRDVSSYSGLALDEGGFYVTSADGAVIKIDRRTGAELWRQEALSRRRLSPPAVVGALVAVADLQGYVHFLHPSNGQLAARVRPLGTRVSAPPVVSGDLLLMTDADGKIAALRVAAVRAATAGMATGGSASSDSGSSRSTSGGRGTLDEPAHRRRPGN